MSTTNHEISSPDGRRKLEERLLAQDPTGKLCHVARVAGAVSVCAEILTGSLVGLSPERLFDDNSITSLARGMLAQAGSILVFMHARGGHLAEMRACAIELHALAEIWEAHVHPHAPELGLVIGNINNVCQQAVKEWRDCYEASPVPQS